MSSYWFVRRFSLLSLLMLSGLLLAACSSDVGEGSSVSGVSSAPGFSVAEVLSGLNGPTQIAFDGDGRLLIAEINGGENDSDGTVSAWSLDDATSTTLLFNGLDKPTGVSFFDDEIWVMERNRLSSGPPSGGTLEPLVADLPNNGRSEGTLTVTPDGRLLYNTSGSKRGGEVVADSGRLWAVEPNAPEAEELADGFKHAYAHTVDASGQIWTTEMTDGTFDGEPAADEVVPVLIGVDHGWPHCVGENRPVTEFGGTTERCADVPPPLATFEPGASPTSIVVAPWDEAVLLVALWNRGQVVQIRTDRPNGQSAEVVISGLQNPQHLLVDGDSVLLSEFGAGRIVRIERADA